MRVAVGAITRQRLTLFGDLLDSFAAMKRPDGVEIIFTFAENDSEHRSTAIIEAFRAKVPEAVFFELEPRPGIPMGRNRVLDMALAQEADLLTFVDDDETVTEDWLVKLVAGVEARDLDLAGAPVEIIAPPEDLTPLNAGVLKHVQQRFVDRNAERGELSRRNADDRLNIYTNNWCLRLSCQQQLGIRFDEALQYTGGSDTKFSRDMMAAGARVGWVPDAVVLEPTPTRRLTLKYQYTRARDQSTNAVILNNKRRSRARKQAIGRMFDAALYCLAFPILGYYGLAKATHKYGQAVGRLRAITGKRSSHYDASSTDFHVE